MSRPHFARILPLGVALTLFSACEGNLISDADGILTLAWDAPTTRVDGSPLDVLSGFRLYVDTESPVDGNGGQAIDLTAIAEHTLTLDPGTHHVAVAALDANGLVSDFSNMLTIQVP
ncbi:MAG: hypothetical protein ACKVPX_18855 [Myxococcaceae bacterium]